MLRERSGVGFDGPGGLSYSQIWILGFPSDAEQPTLALCPCSQCGTCLENPVLTTVPSLPRETGIPLAASSARGSWKNRGGLFWNSWMKINEKILDTKNVYRWQNKTKPCVGEALGPVAGGPWPQQRWLLVFYHFNPVKSRKIHGILRAKLCLAWSCGAGWGLGSPGGDTEVAAVSPSTFPVSFLGREQPWAAWAEPSSASGKKFLI